MFDESIVYMSDVSEIPERTWDRLLRRGERDKTSSTSVSSPDTAQKNFGALDKTAPPPLSILVIDALWPLRPHFSHFSLAQALEAILRLKPTMSYLTDSTHPTTHYMWEEICLSFRGLDGERDHPDAEVTKGLVKRVWETGDIGRGLGDKMRESGLRVEPSWDGLAVEVGGQVGDDGWREVDGPGGSTGGWGI